MQLTQWTKLRKSILFQTKPLAKEENVVNFLICSGRFHWSWARNFFRIRDKEDHMGNRGKSGQNFNFNKKRASCFQKGSDSVLRLISFTCHGVHCTVKLLTEIKFLILRTHPQLITLFFLTGCSWSTLFHMIKPQILTSFTQKRCWGIICLRQFWTEPLHKVILKGRPCFRSAFHLRSKVARTQLRWKRFLVPIW